MPKSEASIDGQKFPEIISQSLQQVGISDILVAKGLETESMLDTLKHSIHKREAVYDFCIVFPVDHPFVSIQTIKKLLEMAFLNPDSVIRPSFQNHLGHPIIIPKCLDIHSNDFSLGLKGIIRHSNVPCVDVPVDDYGILRNINTKEDLG